MVCWAWTCGFFPGGVPSDYREGPLRVSRPHTPRSKPRGGSICRSAAKPSFKNGAMTKPRRRGRRWRPGFSGNREVDGFSQKLRAVHYLLYCSNILVLHRRKTLRALCKGWCSITRLAFIHRDRSNPTQLHYRSPGQTRLAEHWTYLNFEGWMMRGNRRVIASANFGKAGALAWGTLGRGGAALRREKGCPVATWWLYTNRLRR
jgi:hypothetical protein